ncbi:hypothetical protein [Pseudomonas fluorescens]|uniref:DUF2971 domain-containing protein n=1 Tax=Pseudomonas fluorescens TaxID=294 RepID=A0A5E7CGH9_PSEFL|nr:hypothetical protein [Pseudomonas fluorescens]VVO04059.1 hypothetical protein PS710_02903 [Pseudomonas fluorescens]
MAKYLYRFRKFSDLKGDKEKSRESELLGRYIFFASPEKLNDPLEGHREMVWRGDHIVWTNLFAHYFLCLTLRHVDCGEYINIQDVPFSVLHSYLDKPPERANKIKELCATFLKNKNVIQHLSLLSFKEREVKRDELILHLSVLHNYAMHVIAQHLAKVGRVVNGVGIHAASPDELLETSTNILEFFNTLSHDDLLAASHNLQESLLAPVQENALKLNYAIWSESKNERWMDLHINFPERYVTSLKSLCSNSWYTACFMESCSNSAIWGSYGSEHKGACLKFKVDETDQGYALDFHIPSTLNNKSLRKETLDFVKVEYDGIAPDLDFFRSLGALSEPKMLSDWLIRDGNKSSCFDDIYSDVEKWRYEYHSHIQKSITSKTEEWSEEVEQRLLLQSFIFDYAPTENRKLRYNFNSLDSIIFGVNMPLTQKLELIEMVTKLCADCGRLEFTFHQAYFTSSKKIGYREIYKTSTTSPAKSM